jgi:hypothetical protein
MDETPSWLSALDEDELIAMVRRPDLAAKPESARDNGLLLGIALSRADPKESIDKLGNGLLPIAIDGHVSYFAWPDYWQRLKNEFKIFVCTNDKKYSSLKKSLSTSADKSQTTIVATIAAGMAAQFGVVAGVLVPFVAMCLIVLIRLGKEAFCAASKWSTPLIPTPVPPP